MVFLNLLFKLKNKAMKQVTSSQQIFIGIDISKLTLDIVINSGNHPNQHYCIENSIASISDWIAPVLKNCSNQILIGMENTGRYNWPLYEALSGINAKVFVLNPIALSKSLGLARGKNDKIDAGRICDFIRAHHCKLRPWVKSGEAISELKLLLSERAARVKAIKAIKTQRKEYQSMAHLKVAGCLQALAAEQQASLQAQLKQIETLIDDLIDEDPALSAQAALIQSVPGAGKVLCWNMLAKTEGFTTITDAKKMACYCGIAPFEHSSGSSVKRKTRVSSYADKAMKRLLHLAAISSIRFNGDMKSYYERMVGRGKNKMSVINAIRNKIIHRIYAVIRNNHPYKPYNLVLAVS